MLRSKRPPRTLHGLGQWKRVLARSINEQFLDKNIFCPQSSYFTKSDSPDFISAYLYIINNKNYTIFITACLIPRRQIIPVERRYLDRYIFGVRFCDKIRVSQLEEPTENELSTLREKLLSGQVQPRFIEETALVLGHYLSTLFWRPKIAHSETSCHFKSLGPSKVRNYYSFSQLPFIFAPITWHALPWLISTTSKSTTTQSRLHITTPRYQPSYTPRIKLP